MKITACTIHIGNLPFADLSIKASRKYYNHFNINFRVICEPHSSVQESKPKWTASLLYDLFPDSDFIIVHDLDIIPCNLKYNIIDFLDFNEINMCYSFSRIGMKVSDSPFPYFKYNAGLIAYGKQYAHLFKSIFEYGKDDPDKFGTCDQYYINKKIGEEEIYVNPVPILFNTFYHPQIDFTKTSFCHYTYFMRNEDKLRYIEKYHPKDMFE